MTKSLSEESNGEREKSSLLNSFISSERFFYIPSETMILLQITETYMCGAHRWYIVFIRTIYHLLLSVNKYNWARNAHLIILFRTNGGNSFMSSIYRYS